MRRLPSRRKPFRNPGNRQAPNRRGAILVLGAVMLVMILAFAAFTTDVGYLTVSRAQLQNAADAAAFAAGLELSDSLGPGATLTADEADTAARQAAVETAAENVMLDVTSVYADGQRDVRFGRYQWDPSTGSYQQEWDVTPYNMVEVKPRRESGSSDGDKPLSLFFARVIGHDTANMRVTAVGALLPGEGFRPVPGQKAKILPITYDLNSWNVFQELVETAAAGPQRWKHGGPKDLNDPRTFAFAGFRGGEHQFSFARLIHDGRGDRNVFHLVKKKDKPTADDGVGEVFDYGFGFGEDNYAYNPETGETKPGRDGILEIDLYPNAGSELPPGNRGCLRIGKSGTDSLSDQIREGLSDEDLAEFGGELNFDNGPVDVGGEPGMDVSIKDDLQYLIDDLKGETRALPLFSKVTDEGGTNATYTLVKFVGVRIMHVELTGGNKHVIVQPATLIDDTAVPGTGTVADSTIFTSFRLIR